MVEEDSVTFKLINMLRRKPDVDVYKFWLEMSPDDLREKEVRAEVERRLLRFRVRRSLGAIAFAKRSRVESEIDLEAEE